MQELLAVSGPLRDQLLADITKQFHVTQKAGNVCVVEGNAEDIRAFASQPGIASGSDLLNSSNSLPPGTWSLTESFLIAAWLKNKVAPKALRPGDGKSWGAPGFQPPQ